jgi:hypothetical protein
VGVIPYQFLSRSSGAYVCHDFKSFSLEYRPTYTWATKYINSMWSGDNTIFYYQGVNNNLVFNLFLTRRWRFGLLVSYRYWWVPTQKILDNNVATWESTQPKVLESAQKQGLCGGIEFSKYFGNNHFDGAFFVNFTYTSFTGNLTRHKDPSLVASPSQDVTTSFSEHRYNVAIGLKFGYKKAHR